MLPQSFWQGGNFIYGREPSPALISSAALLPFCGESRARTVGFWNEEDPARRFSYAQ